MGQQIDYGNVAAGMAMDATGSLINNLNNEFQPVVHRLRLFASA